MRMTQGKKSGTFVWVKSGTFSSKNTENPELFLSENPDNPELF